MGSMSYCLFENTADDLSRCLDKLEEVGGCDDLTPQEAEGQRRLLKLCKEIHEQFGDDDD